MLHDGRSIAADLQLVHRGIDPRWPRAAQSSAVDGFTFADVPAGAFWLTATEIGLLLHLISDVNGAALVSAGLLSVVAFPSLALALLGRQASGDDGGESAAVPTGAGRHM